MQMLAAGEIFRGPADRLLRGPMTAKKAVTKLRVVQNQMEAGNFCCAIA